MEQNKREKRAWNKKSVIAVAIIVFTIAAALLVGFGVDGGWFLSREQKEGRMTLPDYQTITIDPTELEVTEQEVNTAIAEYQKGLPEPTFTEMTQGVVKEGDIVDISYEGILEGMENPFSGGSSQSHHLTIGSHSFIEGFEEALIGHSPGEEIDIPLQFPEDYWAEGFAGKNVNFHVGIHSILIPEETEEQDFSSEEEMRDYFRNSLYRQKLHKTIIDSLLRESEVENYDWDILAEAKKYSLETLRNYAEAQGVTARYMANMFGFDSLNDYMQNDGRIYAARAMMIDGLMKELDLSCSQEDINEALTLYIRDNGYGDITVDEYRKQAGRPWLWAFEQFQIKGGKVADALQGNIKLVIEPKEEAIEETETETEKESVSEENTEELKTETIPETTGQSEETMPENPEN